MNQLSRFLIPLLSVTVMAGCGSSSDPDVPASVTPTMGPSELNVIAGPDDMTSADIGFVRAVLGQETGLADESEIIEAGYQVCQYEHDGYSQAGAETALANKYQQLRAGQAKVVVRYVLSSQLCSSGGSAGLVE